MVTLLHQISPKI